MTFLAGPKVEDVWPIQARFPETLSTFPIDANSYPNSVLWITQIDVCDSQFTEGNKITFWITSGVAGQGVFYFWQAFVYPSSQATFQWNGRLHVPPGQQLDYNAFGGDWSGVVSGFVSPYGASAVLA